MRLITAQQIFALIFAYAKKKNMFYSHVTQMSSSPLLEITQQLVVSVVIRVSQLPECMLLVWPQLNVHQLVPRYLSILYTPLPFSFTFICLFAIFENSSSLLSEELSIGLKRSKALSIVNVCSLLDIYLFLCDFYWM